ncbi:MAG: thiamine-phosphate kinase [Rhodobiaceae bacterium]|nr:thiamine-phosphate kinase [Rhodobiaceae bacterium]
MGGPISSEEEIIARYLRPLAARAPGSLDLSDDAALIRPSPGAELVVTTDMLVAGVHFFADAAPRDIATKAVTANLSDLVAKGAEPIGYLMTLALPDRPDESWLAEFTAGLDRQMDGRLLGGDLTRTDGPLAITIVAIGEVPEGRMVRRSGGKPGDALFLTGEIGSAALGLRLVGEPALSAELGLDDEEVAGFVAATRAPVVQRPAETAALLRTCASAAMDVSDGLLIDLERLCRVSGTGASIEADAIPLAIAARRLVDEGRLSLLDLATGGDDYVALFAVDAARSGDMMAAAAGHVFPIGRLTPAHEGIAVLDGAGQSMMLPAKRGYDHF